MQRHTFHRILPALLAGVFMITLLPMPVQAGYMDYGDIIDGAKTDDDITHLLSLTLAVASGSEVAFEDDDTNGAVGTTEAVYIDSDGSGTVTPLDIRIRSTTGVDGALVKTGDGDCCGNALTPAPGAWGFVDLYPSGGPDGALNLGEGLFLDLDGSGTVTTSDIEIMKKQSGGTSGIPTRTGAKSFQNAAASHAEAGMNLTALANYTLAVADLDANGVFGFADRVYLDVDANGLPGPGDVRIAQPDTTTSLPPGTMPEPDDADTVHDLMAAGGALAFADADINGVVGPTEGIYYDADGNGNVTAGDVRFVPSGSTTTGSGEQVEAGDSDLGTALATFPGNGFMYHDLDGDGVLDLSDAFYIEVDGDTAVEANDFRIYDGDIAETKMRRVVAPDDDVALTLTAAPGALMAYDFNGGGAYNLNDVLIYDSNGDGLITPRDLALSRGPAPFGTAGMMVDDTDEQTVFCYDFNFAGGAIGYTEFGGAGVVNVDEPVYFDRGATGTVAVHDVRISSHSGIGNGGTFVEVDDIDRNDVLSTPPAAGAAFAWYDANGDSVYSGPAQGTVADAVYYDTDGSSTVTAGDVHITDAPKGTGQPGSKVQGTSGDLNLALTAFAGHVIKGIDADADGFFTQEDALYINVDDAVDTAIIAAGCVTPGDVRLSGTGGGTNTGGGGGGGGGAPPPAQTTTTAPPTTTTTTPPSGPETAVVQAVINANAFISFGLTVTRADGDNHLEWPAQPDINGYQVWGSTSPFTLLVNLSADATDYVDADAPEDRSYIVTAWAVDSEGLVVGTFADDDINSQDVPGVADIDDAAAQPTPAGTTTTTTMPADTTTPDTNTTTTPADKDGSAVGIVLVLGVIGAALVAVRRRL